MKKAPRRPKTLLKHREDVQKQERRRRQKELQLQKVKRKRKRKKSNKATLRKEQPEDLSIQQQGSRPVHVLIARKKKDKTTGKNDTQKRLLYSSDSSSDDENEEGRNNKKQSISVLDGNPNKPKPSALKIPNVTKRQRSGKSNLEQQTEEEDDDDAEEKDTTVKAKRKRQQLPGKNKVAPNKNQWTEVMAPGHALADEVKQYTEEHNESLTQTEKEYLQTWVNNVQKDLEQQNVCLLENIQLVTDLRQINKQCNQLQAKLLHQRRQLQIIQQETQMYKHQAQQAEEQQSTMAGANRFLESLQNLARKRGDP